MPVFESSDGPKDHILAKSKQGENEAEFNEYNVNQGSTTKPESEAKITHE